MKENQYDKCEIYGKNLIYATKNKDYKELKCNFCDKIFNSNTFCEDGHFIGQTCHSKGPIEIIELICEEINIRDPFELANVIIKHLNFKVYGPDHHVLTTAVILTALKNNYIKKPDGRKNNLF